MSVWIDVECLAKKTGLAITNTIITVAAISTMAMTLNKIVVIPYYTSHSALHLDIIYLNYSWHCPLCFKQYRPGRPVIIYSTPMTNNDDIIVIPSQNIAVDTWYLSTARYWAFRTGGLPSQRHPHPHPHPPLDAAESVSMSLIFCTVIWTDSVPKRRLVTVHLTTCLLVTVQGIA